MSTAFCCYISSDLPTFTCALLEGGVGMYHGDFNKTEMPAPSAFTYNAFVIVLSQIHLDLKSQCL